MVMYTYMAIMLLAFIFCMNRKSHSVGVTMQTVQEMRIKR